MATLKTWAASRWPATLAGLLLVALLIWLGGPYLGIGDRQPLAAPSARLALILLMLLAWVAALQLAQWRARRRTGQLSGELAEQEARLGEDRAGHEREHLRERFQEAIEILRKTRRGGGNLYALPWYAVIGAPGSGKSTLIRNGGLDFPLAGRFGREALDGIGGTRDCDWWFTDAAVFLDTAGRYTSQDSDAAVDASAWEAFLQMLRRHRRRRPLNGVIVTASMADLLTLDEAGRRQHARTLRSRLDELARHLRMRVPVYLVFTKCDLVAGFGEFFDDLGPELRGQVWGMTFPAAKTLDGSAPALFEAEYELLMARLATRTVERLHGERDRRRRAAVLAFPQQMAALRQVGRQFVEGVFAAHTYAATSLLRGVYLTSGTQEGTPIDRLLGAVARTFGIDAARVQAQAGQATRAFFVERLLRDVLFPESGFAGTEPRLERRRLLLQAAAYAGIAALSALWLLGMATSYARNRAYVAQVQAALQDFPRAEAAAAPSLAVYLARALARLEVLASARQAADQYQGHVPLLMRFGLYQGAALGAEVHDAYLRESSGTLLPGAGALLRQSLGDSAADPQALYHYLKAYLMLGEPAHREPAELAALARIEWRQLFPQDRAVREALDRHFSALLEDAQAPRSLALDGATVERARASLRAADLSTLAYGSLKFEAERTGAPPVRLDQTLGLLGNVFRRKSGRPLSEPLPALFTQPLFAAEAGQGIGQSVDGFLKDDWVFGTASADPLARSRLTQQVLQRYEQDYIKAWDELLGDLTLQPVTSIQDASAAAAKLSGPGSPLKALLKLVRDNTHDLLRAAPGTAAVPTAALKGVAGRLAEQRVLARSQLARELADAGVAPAGAPSGEPAERPGSSIEQHFADLDALTDGAPGATPLDHTIAVLDRLGKRLLSMGDFGDPAVRADPALLEARQEAAQLPPAVAGIVAGLTGKSQALVADGAGDALDQAFRQAAGSDCARFTRDRYPFAAGSGADIPLQDFNELFGNGGRFDSFFKQSLSGLVDTSGRAWRWKNASAAGSPTMLAQAQLADGIRQAYFRGGPQAEVAFTVQVPPADPAIGKVAIDIDGQHYDYPAGGPGGAAMKWPGPGPARVSVAAFDRDGRPLGAPLLFQGDWALFHALDAGHLRRLDDLRYEASFEVAGHALKLDIRAGSLRNPFLDGQAQRFRCAG